MIDSFVIVCMVVIFVGGFALGDIARESREENKRTTLSARVKDLYFAAYWKSDRLPESYEKILWERVRDAAFIQPGQTSSILGKPRF